MNLPIPQPLPRIEAFEQLAYGLFLHLGLYSQMGRGEWIQLHAGIKKEDYAPLMSTFTAKDFDAKAIARLAKDSGMKYACLTTRHHEGFSLYDTRGLSDFDAPHSPAQRDLVAEFADACRAEDVVPFFYHTTLDWRWDSAGCSDEKFAEYLDYLNDSVEILCKHYGKIGGLWFDGNWSRKGDWKEDRLYATIRKYQPEAIIINNTGLSAQGVAGNPELDSVTFEQGLPTAPDRRGWPKYLAGEMCETMNSHWGIGKMDFNFKSPGELIRHLCACRKTGANYLLNVGPTAEGAIPAYESAALQKVGEWIKAVGSSLYKGKPVAVRCEGHDFVLQDGDHYYYFAYDLRRKGDSHVVQGGGGSNGPRKVEGFPIHIRKMRWLDDDENGKFSQSEDAQTLTLECTGYDYGHDLIVRVAELTPT